MVKRQLGFIPLIGEIKRRGSESGAPPTPSWKPSYEFVAEPEFLDPGPGRRGMPSKMVCRPSDWEESSWKVGDKDPVRALLYYSECKWDC